MILFELLDIEPELLIYFFFVLFIFISSIFLNILLSSILLSIILLFKLFIYTSSLIVNNIKHLIFYSNSFNFIIIKNLKFSK